MLVKMPILFLIPKYNMAPKKNRKSKLVVSKMRDAPPGKKLVKAVRAIAKQESLRAQETKLVIQTPFSGPGTGSSPPNLITNKLISIAGPGNLQNLQPAIPQLLASTLTQQGTNTLEGAKCRLVSGKTDFLFNIKEDLTATLDIIVKVFCVLSKSAKSLVTAKYLPGEDFLRNGEGATIDWDGVASTYAPILNNYPINKLAWDVSRVFTIRLSKNAGKMNGDATPGAPATANLSAAHNYHMCTWNWGVLGPEVLKYEEQAGPTTSPYPNNFCPMYGVVAYYADGTSLGGEGAQVPVACTITNTMFFKDA